MTQHFYVIRISLKSKLKAHSCFTSELELVLNFYYSSFILFYSVELNYNKSNNKYCTKQTTIIYIFLILRISIIITTYLLYLRTAISSTDLFITKFGCLGKNPNYPLETYFSQLSVNYFPILHYFLILITFYFFNLNLKKGKKTFVLFVSAS